jgi:hypothetical protein
MNLTKKQIKKKQNRQTGRPKSAVHRPRPTYLFVSNETEGRGGRGGRRDSGEPSRRFRRREGLGMVGMGRPSSGGPPRTRSVTGGERTGSSPSSPAERGSGGRRARRIRHQPARGRGQGALRELTELAGVLGWGGGGLERGGGREGRAAELGSSSGPEASVPRLKLPVKAREEEE